MKPKSDGNGWVWILCIPSSDATDTIEGLADSCWANKSGSVSNKKKYCKLTKTHNYYDGSSIRTFRRNTIFQNYF